MRPRWMGAITALLVLCSAATSQAGLLGLGLGAYGGVNIPIVQDDAKTGSVWGFRAPVQALKLLRLEPFVAFINNGDYEITGIGGAQTFDGGKLTAFGINAMFGAPMTVPAVGIAFVGGIGSYKYEAEGYDSNSDVGFNVGVDFTFGLGALPVGLSARGDLVIIPLDDGGSRKHGLLTVGAFYKFGI